MTLKQGVRTKEKIEKTQGRANSSVPVASLPSLDKDVIKENSQKTANVVLVRPKGAKPRENVDIERLVMWACSEQMAGHGVFDDDLSMMDAGSLWQTIERLALLGTNIDTSRGDVAGYRCHPDADHVIDAMRHCLDENERVLVFGYCSAGLRPDWEPDGVGAFEPVRNGRGGVKMVWGNRAQRRDPIACLVKQVGASWHHVEFARQQYEDWHRALVKLVNVLWGRLESRCPTGPSAARRPWNEKVLDLRKDLQ